MPNKQSIEKLKRSGTLHSKRYGLRTIEGHGAPEPPPWITRGGAAIWSLCVPGLSERKFLTFEDSIQLAELCEILALLKRERRKAIKNQDAGLILRMSRHVFQLTDRLGLSPKARTMIDVPADDGEDTLDSFKLA